MYPLCYLKFYTTLPKSVLISQPKILSCLLKPAFPFPCLFYSSTHFLTLFHPLLGTSKQLRAKGASQASSLFKGIPQFSHLSGQYSSQSHPSAIQHPADPRICSSDCFTPQNPCTEGHLKRTAGQVLQETGWTFSLADLCISSLCYISASALQPDRLGWKEK